MKKIAFYLPQYHAIPENDEWWGKGFTEWTNVKASHPQYKGHIQPEVPLHHNYYCLLDENVQVEQSRLALQYGLDGFCYYHYWFEGKLLLEKPIENMLHNPQIEIPFCICWANETWSRTWDGRNTSILIEQNYNEDKAAWTEHFNYLLQFFKDKRYILHQGMPMLIIYNPQLITNCREMIDLWRQLARENGFPDLYIGYQYPLAFDSDTDSLGMNFGIEFEPVYTVMELDKEKSSLIGMLRRAFTNPQWFKWRLEEKLLHHPKYYNYDEMWERIIRRYPVKSNVMPGAFCAWDNTPRRGNKATIYRGAAPHKFEQYLIRRLQTAKERYYAEYIFINAWNEWAEGAHLEPDEVNGYGYLEAIRNASDQ